MSVAQNALTWRFALREMRGGLRGFAVFISCIALGVAAIAGVGSFARSLGGTAEQTLYPDADHAFNLDTETPTVARANERAYRFIEKALAGK